MSALDSTRKYYQSRGLAAESGFGARPAIVLVDLVRGFTDPESKLGANFDSVVEENVRLLKVARNAKKIPVIFTTVIYEDPSEGGAFLIKVPSLREFVPGSPHVKVDERLARQQNEPLLGKKYASSFFGTPLASILAFDRVDTVIVTGVTTSGCVRATAVDALQHGYRVIVPREAVGDRAQGPHEANLFDLGAKYADVVSVDNVLDYISNR